MAEIIGVRFKGGGKQYYFDPQGITVSPGEAVIIETSRGIEYGECVKGNTVIADEELVAPLRPVLRVATDEDKEAVAKNKEREKRAFRICQQKIEEHGLDMKLVDVEYNFERNKILFFFTSEGRVDFRALVKDLAAIFHTRIELRQIGVRDEAKMLGGLGICGKPFCCSTFLGEFQPVSIKMAKTQNLSLNPTKISGTCGRLMCCLKYEQGAYEDALKRCPKMDSFVETPDGVGTVTNVNLLRELVRVRLDDTDDMPKHYHCCEIHVVRSGKGKRPEDYVPPPAHVLEKRRMAPQSKPKEDRGTGLLDNWAGLRDLTEPQKPAPAPGREGAQPGSSGQEKKRRGRSRKKSPPKEPKAGAPAAGKQPAHTAQNRQQQAAPQGEKTDKKPASRRRRWRGKPKTGGDSKG